MTFKLPRCKCGCGKRVRTRDYAYFQGHDPEGPAKRLAGRTRHKLKCSGCSKPFRSIEKRSRFCASCREPRSCACGCERMVKTPGRLYARGHNPSAHTAEVHAKQGRKIRGARNPAKRMDVREKIALAVRQQRRVSGPEIRLAEYLPFLRTQHTIGPYTVDFANRRVKVAVEFLGCFWHSCPRCYPQREKLHVMQQRSLRRDERRARYLTRQGWHVVYVWEHELSSSFDAAASKLAKKVKRLIHERQR